MASPITRKLKSWDLSAIRNSFLAHNFREKGKTNVLIKEHEGELNTPSTFGDIMLLCGCIFCTKQILIAEFTPEYNELVIHLKAIKPPKVKEGIASEDLAKKELDQLIDQSNALKETYVRLPLR